MNLRVKLDNYHAMTEGSPDYQIVLELNAVDVKHFIKNNLDKILNEVSLVEIQNYLEFKGYRTGDN